MLVQYWRCDEGFKKKNNHKIIISKFRYSYIIALFINKDIYLNFVNFYFIVIYIYIIISNFLKYYILPIYNINIENIIYSIPIYNTSY